MNKKLDNRFEQFFYMGKTFYDKESFFKFVEEFPDRELNEKDFNYLFSMLAKNIWINTEVYNKIPKAKEFNLFLSKVFEDAINKFLSE